MQWNVTNLTDDYEQTERQCYTGDLEEQLSSILLFYMNLPMHVHVWSEEYNMYSNQGWRSTTENRMVQD